MVWYYGFLAGIVILMVYVLWKRREEIELIQEGEIEIAWDRMVNKIESDQERHGRMVVVEHRGKRIRMSEWQRDEVWVKMPESQKLSALRPVAREDMEEIYIDGVRCLTNKEGTSKVAKNRK